MEVFETFFSDVMTTQNYDPTFVKHVLGNIYAFFSLFGYWMCRGLGGSQGTTIADEPIHSIEIHFLDPMPDSVVKDKVI